MNILEHITETLVEFLTPAGAILIYGGEDTPPGWSFANGQAVSRSANPKLFARYGTKYGTGDGESTFNLPDLRGRCAVGHDVMGSPEAAGRLTNFSTHGIDGSTLGATGGSERLDATLDSMFQENGGIFGFEAGESMNNVQPSIVLNFIIKMG